MLPSVEVGGLELATQFEETLNRAPQRDREGGKEPKASTPTDHPSKAGLTLLAGHLSRPDCRATTKIRALVTARSIALSIYDSRW